MIGLYRPRDRRRRKALVEVVCIREPDALERDLGVDGPLVEVRRCVWHRTHSATARYERAPHPSTSGRTMSLATLETRYERIR